MKMEHFRVTVLNRADKSDPGNLMLSAVADALVDGVHCGWMHGVVRAVPPDEASDFERIIAGLVNKILTKPMNPIRVEDTWKPELTVTIPEVEVLA